MRARLVAAVALVAVSATAAAHGSGRSRADVGTLELHEVFVMKSAGGDCPVGAYPPSVECFARTGVGVVPGLGNVSETYAFAVDTEPGARCPGRLALGGSPARFKIAGKGEIELAVAPSADCFTELSILGASRAFTVTGGSGLYAGASGSGTLTHDAHLTNTGAAGTDSWDGAVIIPELAFDVIAPTLRGARGKGGPRTAEGKIHSRQVHRHQPGRRRRLATGDLQTWLR
jgi:hypothetical protein